jgi:ketosteroid isomerase-like protein
MPNRLVRHFPLVALLIVPLVTIPLILILIPLISVGSLGAQTVVTNNVESAIEHVLRAQQQAWNRHDLEGFMAGYWNSPELTFFSGAKENHGWQAALDRYRADYASPGKEMGKLEFSALRIEMLGADAAFGRGVWLLTMPDGKTRHGLFTLVFRKFPEGWKIVHDHTSAE